MTTSNITIAIDAMGGDYGLQVTIPAVIMFLSSHEDADVILVGDKPIIEKQLNVVDKDKKFINRLTIVHASEVVGMGEPPAKALRNKKDSSMRVAINLVKDGQARACVSAGNTGALMATAKFVLKTIPGISRPAIISRIPSLKSDEFCCMLDLGANLDCTGQHLFQFAVMGAVVASAVHGLKRPRVGLINVGEEQIKGNEPVKEANNLLLRTPEIEYVGFIEGNDIFTGKVNVVVCDGFIGNVALKTSEGLLKNLFKIIRNEFSRHFINIIFVLLVKWVLKDVMRKMNPSNYNGASLVGLNGIVIKSHGSAGVEAFCNAIHLACQEIKLNVPSQIQHQVSSLVKEH